MCSRHLPSSPLSLSILFCCLAVWSQCDGFSRRPARALWNQGKCIKLPLERPTVKPCHTPSRFSLPSRRVTISIPPVTLSRSLCRVLDDASLGLETLRALCGSLSLDFAKVYHGDTHAIRAFQEEEQRGGAVDTAPAVSTPAHTAYGMACSVVLLLSADLLLRAETPTGVRCPRERGPSGSDWRRMRRSAHRPRR